MNIKTKNLLSRLENIVEPLSSAYAGIGSDGDEPFHAFAWSTIKAKFTELIVYKFRFWDYTHIFIFGKSADNDQLGLKLTSEFDYNP